MQPRAQTEPQKKRRGKTGEELMRISKATQWKKGQSGNPKGSLGEKAISEGLRRFYSENPQEFLRLLSAAHRKATGKNPHPKFWELIADRVEGKVAQQVDVQASVTHVFTEKDRQEAIKTIERIESYRSSSTTPIAGELVEENEEENEEKEKKKRRK